MELFLNPASVAYVGAPRDTGIGAHNNVEIALRYGYPGRIYPVNPKASEIVGLKSYSTVLGLPEIPDLTVISLGRDRVLQAFRDCLEKGVKRVIIISQGFADADQRGKDLQEEITALARRAGVRIIGPNTMGIVNAYSGLSTAFMDIPRCSDAWPVTLITQTGVFQVAQESFVGKHVEKTIDLGNSCDVDIVDILEYLENDSRTKVIAIHMEGINDGRRFMELASRVSSQKPIVVLKTGRSTAGAQAVLSHTGSLVGEDAVFDAAFQRAGIIRVNDATEMKDTVRSLVKFPAMRTNKIGVITPSGAAGIIATDISESEGVIMPPMPENLEKELQMQAPDWFDVDNPADIWPVAIKGSYFDVFNLTLKGFMEDEDIGGIAVVACAMTSPLHTDFDNYKIITNLKSKLTTDKPISVWVYGDRAWEERQALEQIPNVATYPSIERAIKGLAVAYRYHNRFKQTAQKYEGIKVKVPASTISRTQLSPTKNIILGQEALSLLGNYGISAPESQVVQTKTGALKAAASLGYPVVLKIISSKLLHKTELGGVLTEINNPIEVEQGYELLMEKASNLVSNSGIEGILVQKQVLGKELILGIKKDPQFGPVIICGTGGIYAEVLKDITRELVPVSKELAEDMLRRLKGFPLLSGVRGEKPVNIDKIVDTIVNLSHFAAETPDIKELDINPLMASLEDCRAVDARIIF